jgi:hypothetical protein
MATNKYDKFVINEPIVKGRFAPVLHLCGERHAEYDCGGVPFGGFPSELTSMCISEPLLMDAAPHSHDYDQLLCFIGGNPQNIFDFGAEVEITLGEEGEKHLISSTSIVYVPRGMMHCPLNFAKVEKPVTFMHICFSPVYTRAVGDMTARDEKRRRYSSAEIKNLKNKS